jgi:soluble lytic murein transglycosylase
MAGICAGILLFLRPWPEHPAGGTMIAATDSASPAATAPEMAQQVRTEPDAVPRETAKADRLESAHADSQPVQDAPPAPAQDAGAPPQDNATAASADAQAPRAFAEPQSELLAAVEPFALKGRPLTTGAMPKPGSPMSKPEMDEALRPLLAYELSATDIANLKDIVRLVQKEDFAPARLLMGKLTDSGAQNLVRWYYYRSGGYDLSPEELADFRESNPLWPDRDELEAKVEEALFWREPNPKKVLAYFQEHRPVTGAGKAAFGAALITAGKAEDGQALIRTAWREHYLTPALETRFKDNFGDVLRPEDHKARLDWLLVKNRKSDLKTIERMVPLVDKKWEKAIQAEIAGIKGDKKAGAMLAALEGNLKSDPAVLLARIAWAKHNDKDEAVWELLRAAPTDGRKLVNPMSWWDYRETQVRTALNSGQPKIAYELAKGYGGELPAEDLSDAEFLSGWIALRFLNDAKTAHRHLLAAAAAGGLPKHRARANYWLGRTELSLGNKRGAAARFAEAAQYTHTFYGQLARQVTEAKAVQFTMRPYARPNKSDIRSFTRDPVITALAAANKAGLDGIVPIFLDDLARQITSAPEMTLACELATRISGPHRAVRMAKIAMNRGFPVEQYAYPDALPEFKMLSGDALEEPLIHALTRQESEFNPATVSSAGAVGLMQLLPSTAKEVARALAVKFEKKKLTSDPSYNLSLGSAYLDRLIRSYDGSYIMALAAYNAGAGRVKQWVAQFGDPRDKKVDPVDWIERIPFTETRDYVIKIMESAQVYRARLNASGDTLRLVQDLHRGRSDEPRTFLEAGMH